MPRKKETESDRLIRNLDRELDDDFEFDLLRDTRQRLDKVEHQISDAITRDALALLDDPVTARGERVLAKAQDVLERMATPEDVLERAQRVMTNAVDIGIVQGFLSVGTQESFAKAVSLVGEQEDRNERAHAETAVGGMLEDFGEAENTQNLRQEVATLSRSVTTLTGRLDRLESRPGATQQEVVAKAYTRTDTPSSTAKNDGASLLQRGQGVIDSVSTIGVLSSLVNDGKLGEARSMVESAELDHEAKVKAAERRRLR